MQNQLTWFCSFRRKQQSLAPFSVKLGSGENIPFRRYNAGSAHFGKILLISRNHFAKPVVAKKFAGIDFAKPNIRYRSCLTQVLVSSALGGIMLKIIRCQLRGTEPKTFFPKHTFPFPFQMTPAFSHYTSPDVNTNLGGSTDHR